MKFIFSILALFFSYNYVMADENKWSRPYFDSKGNKPYVFYVIFGADSSKLKLSKKKHNLTGMPKGLNIRKYNKKEHGDYINGFLKGTFKKMLNKQSDLAKNIMNSDQCVVVEGVIENDESLEYLRNVIGIVKAVSELDAVGIFDMLTVRWYFVKAWSDIFFKPNAPEVLNQIVIMYSEEKNKVWLHTRGMRKFGRPDISIVGVNTKSLSIAKKLINRFINLFALGGVPNDKQEIKVSGLPKGMLVRLKGDYDNLDFNNYYIEVEWK